MIILVRQELYLYLQIVWIREVRHELLLGHLWFACGKNARISKFFAWPRIPMVILYQVRYFLIIKYPSCSKIPIPGWVMLIISIRHTLFLWTAPFHLSRLCVCFVVSLQFQSVIWVHPYVRYIHPNSWWVTFHHSQFYGGRSGTETFCHIHTEHKLFKKKTRENWAYHYSR